MQPFYVTKLNDVFADRKVKNSSYSLRAFARDLEMDSSNLGAIMKGKRALPTKRVDYIVEKLKLTAIEKSEFVDSAFRRKFELDKIKIRLKNKKVLTEDLHFDVIAKWEYYAIFELLKTKEDNFVDVLWISERLNISEEMALLGLDALEKIKLIEIKQRKFFLSEDMLDTSFNISSKALMFSHLESLNLAKQKIKEIDVDKRDYSSLTIPIPKESIPVIKGLIREFQDKICSLVDSYETTEEVYMLSSQFFPLTVQEKTNE